MYGKWNDLTTAGATTDLAKLQAVLQARPHWRALVDDALATP